MALIKEKINYPFAQGIDTKTDDKQLSFEKLLVLENGRFNKIGKIEKRFGTEPISINIYGGGTLSNITKIFNREDELLCIADSKLYSYSEVTNSWVNKNNVSKYKINTDTYKVTNATTTHYISCQSSGYKLIVSVSSSNVLTYSLMDVNTETFLAIQQTITTGIGALYPFYVFATSTNFCIIWAESAIIKYILIPISTLIMSSESTLVSNVDNTGSVYLFDAVQSGNSIYLVYKNSLTSKLAATSFNINTSATSSADITVGTVSSLTNFAICSNSTNLYITYRESNYFYGLCVDILFNNIISSTVLENNSLTSFTVRNIINYVEDSTLYSYYSYDTNTTDNNYTSTVRQIVTPITSAPSFSTSTIIDFARQSGIISKIVGLNHFIALVYYNKYKDIDGTTVLDHIGNSFFYFQDKDGYIIGTCLQYEIYNDDLKKFVATGQENDTIISIPTLKNISSTKQLVTCPIDVNLEKINNYNISGLDTLLISGSINKEYTGLYNTENNFLRAPNIISISSVPDAGVGLEVGTYTITAIYTYQDKFGSELRSEVSAPRSITISAKSYFSVVVEDNSQSEKKYYNIKLFITDGTNFWSKTEKFSEIVILPKYNATRTITISTTTSNFIEDDVVYTNSGELNNVNTTNANFFTKTKNRIFYVSTIDKNTVYYSKLIGETNVIEFNPNLYFDIIGGTGYITGIASMDDKLIIFKENDIFVVGGDGPDNTGSNNTFSEPASISTDVGCINQDSIVLTNNGLMFQSNKGIYLLNRSLQVEFIGAPVDDYKNETIKAAHLLDDYNEVRFLTENRCLVYNYYVDQWAIFTYSGVHAHIYDNTYYFTDGTDIFKENESIFTDDSDHYALKITTPWLALNNIHNLQRVYCMYLLGTYKSAHSLKITTYYDYDLTDTDTTTIVSSTDYTTSSVYQMRVFFKKQKCEAIKISIEDVQTSSIGEGLSLSNLQITYGRKKGNKSVNSYKTE